MKKVAVILSTYNGEQYVEEQLNSIILQSYDDITIFIRDDGSQDDTVSIIKKVMENNASRKEIVLLEDKKGNLGFGNSFLTILKAAEGFDYYAFCDQDDRWLEDKILRAVQMLERSDSGRPAMYASNYYIADDKLNVQGEYAKTFDHASYTLAQVFMGGFVSGFTMVINDPLKKLALEQKEDMELLSHDKWVSAVLVGMEGTFYYDSQPQICYRRHKGTASPTDQNQLQRWIWRWKNVMAGDFLGKTRQMARMYEEIYGTQIIKKKDQSFLKAFTRKGVKGYFKRLFIGQRLRRSFFGEIMVRALLLLGK